MGNSVPSAERASSDLSEQRTSGIRVPPDPPRDKGALAVVSYYLRYYEVEYARARRVVKRRSSRAVVISSLATGGIAVLGVASAAWASPVFGLASTSLAGVIGVIAAWDSHFAHRDLWIQRSLVLSEIQELKRNVELEGADVDDSESHEELAKSVKRSLSVARVG